MGRIEITGGKDPPIAKILLGGHFFHLLRMHEHLTRISIGMLRNPLLGLDIIDDGVGLHGIIRLDHFGKPDDIARRIPVGRSDHQIAVCRQVGILKFGIRLGLKGYLPGRDPHNDGVRSLVIDLGLQRVFGDSVIRGIGAPAITNPDNGVPGGIARIPVGIVKGREKRSGNNGPDRRIGHGRC